MEKERNYQLGGYASIFGAVLAAEYCLENKGILTMKDLLKI